MFRLRLIAATALAAVVAAAVSAQSPSPQLQPQTPYLRGRVIDGETGAPVSGATIRLSGRADITLVTGADGRYQSQTLKPGLYDLIAAADGYLPAAPMWGEAIPLLLHVDEEGIGPPLLQRDWMLERASRIRGQVLDVDGRAIAGADVFAAKRMTSSNGWPRFNRRGSAVTAADGRFEIDGLAPGPYVLAYRVKRDSIARWFFSPGIPDPRHASQVEARHDDSLPPVVMRAATVDTPPVSVRVRTPAGHLVNDALVQVETWSPFPDLELAREYPQAAAGKDGIARFEKLPAGPHRVIARTPASLELPASARGEADLMLPEKIVSGVDVRLRPAIDTCAFTRIETASVGGAGVKSLPAIAASTSHMMVAGEQFAARVPLGEMFRFRGAAQGARIQLRALDQSPLWALSRFTPPRPGAPRGEIPADAGSSGCATAYFQSTTKTIEGKIDLPDQEWLPHVDVIATPIANPAAPIAVGILTPDFKFRIVGIADDMRYAVTAVPAGMHDMPVAANRRVIAVGGSTIVVPLSMPVAR